jgi:protein PsiE
MQSWKRYLGSDSDQAKLTKKKGGITVKNTKIDELIHLSIINIEKLLLIFIVAGTVWAACFDIIGMFDTQNKMALSDLFLLFIYAEVLGMIGAFYKDNRIPVTLPLIIAMTALTRMIVLTTKGSDTIDIVYESLGILILAISALILSYKDKLSLQKLRDYKNIANETE